MTTLDATDSAARELCTALEGWYQDVETHGWKKTGDPHPANLLKLHQPCLDALQELSQGESMVKLHHQLAATAEPANAI